jgi:hypothetical protein
MRAARRHAVTGVSRKVPVFRPRLAVAAGGCGWRLRLAAAVRVTSAELPGARRPAR